MEINKTILSGKKYIRIKLNNNEYVGYLDCIKEKLLNPLPGDKEIDIGNELYTVLLADVAKKLGEKLVELKGKWIEIKFKKGKNIKGKIK